MQNTSDILYTQKSKVINLKSELLCREAEDDFFYFNDINGAYKKLKQAVDLSPFHFKSILLFADVCFVKGLIKEAFFMYKRAENISPSNLKVLASIANCNYVLENYSSALKYIEKSIELLTVDSISLHSQLLEMKISILMIQKNYKQAHDTLVAFENIVDINSLESVYNINYDILKQKLNLQKRLKESVLKIV